MMLMMIHSPEPEAEPEPEGNIPATWTGVARLAGKDFLLYPPA